MAFSTLIQLIDTYPIQLGKDLTSVAEEFGIDGRSIHMHNLR